MTKSYEELVGGLGHAVAYRAERYLVRDFLDRHAAQLAINGETFTLHDISMNGLSFYLGASDSRWTPGDELQVGVLVRDEPVHQGPARIVRTEDLGPRPWVALQLTQGFLDLPEIQRRFHEQQLASELTHGPAAVRDLVPHEYRQVIERAVHFIQHYREVLDRHERRYAEMGTMAQKALEDFGQRAVEQLRKPWNDIREEAAAAALPCLADPNILRAAKRYTETVVTPLLLGSPVIDRTYHKPLGYAGDYVSMLQIYRNQLEGASVFDRVFHKLAVEEPLAAGVRTRKDLVKQLTTQEYTRFLSNGSDGQLFRATSLGSGPAREVSEFVAETPDLSAPVHWNLIDQEEAALSLAYQGVFSTLSTSDATGSVRCIYMSFAQFLSDPSTALVEEPQQFVYAAGLFDYLRESRAQALVKGLYDRVAPGGLLAVGNALWPNEHFWFGEFVLDWTLLYRDRSQMKELAATLPDGATIEVVEEPSRAYYFVLIRKP